MPDGIGGARKVTLTSIEAKVRAKAKMRNILSRKSLVRTTGCLAKSTKPQSLETLPAFSRPSDADR